VVLPCRSGMPESPLLFSVPACGSYLLCSQKVEGSKARAGRQMGRWADGCRVVGGARSAQGRADSRAIVGRRRTALLKIAPRSSFPRRRESTLPMTMGPRLRGDDINPQMGPRSPAFAEDKFRGDDGDIQNRGNKARMCMKTKDRRGNRPPLNPPYPRRGIAGLPSSDEEGLRVVGLCILRAHFAFICNWLV